MNTKMIATVLSIVVVLSCTSVVSLLDVDADTDEVANVNVYYYTDAGSCSCVSVYAYDLYQALVAAQSELEFTFELYSEDATDYQGYAVTYEGGSWNAWHDATAAGYPEEYSYWDINPYYGTLTKINGSDVLNYSIYVGIDSEWVTAEPALGWYRPFQDYADVFEFENGASAGSANILIAPDGVDVPYPENAMELTSISKTGTDYRYTFFIQDDSNSITIDGSIPVIYDISGTNMSGFITTSNLQEGVTIVGYGSDAYLALNDALSGYIEGQSVREDNSQDPPTYYSWLETIFDVGTVSDFSQNEEGYWVSTYIYWASYTSGGTYLDYTLGYYSGLPGAANSGTDFRLVYEKSEYVYSE